MALTWDTFLKGLLAIVFILSAGTLAYVVKNQKQRILSLITDLVQKAEAAIQGSGMGEEKKKIVIAQLEAMGIKVTERVSEIIDQIVAYLNGQKAWLANVVTIKYIPDTTSSDETQKV